MTDEAPPPPRFGLDRMGVVLSGICAVHCLLSIVVISLLGLGAGALLDPAIHRFGLGLAVGIGAATLGIGVVRHGDWRPLALGGAGLLLMGAGLLVPHGPQEALLTIIGVALVACAHLLNIRRAPQSRTRA